MWDIIDTVEADGGVFDITGLDLSGYDALQLILAGVTAEDDETDIILTFYIDGSEVTTGYRNNLQGRSINDGINARAGQTDVGLYLTLDNATTDWRLGNASNETFGGEVLVGHPADALHKNCIVMTEYVAATGAVVFAWGGGGLNTTGIITGIHVKGVTASGDADLTGGTLTILGLSDGEGGGGDPGETTTILSMWVGGVT